MKGKEEGRIDQTYELGKPLSQLEERCYKIICHGGVEPISAFDLFVQLYGYEPESKHYYDLMPLRQIVRRVRKRLGTNSIITYCNKGYISRRALIEAKTGNRKPLNVLNEIKAEIGTD